MSSFEFSRVWIIFVFNLVKENDAMLGKDAFRADDLRL